VHLLLSTFAVQTEDRQILNVALYVQCGAEPQIKVICKGRSSDIDIQFDNKKLFSQQEISEDEETSEEDSQDENLEEESSEEQEPNICSFIGSKLNKKNMMISNDSIFVIKTKGGAQFTQAIDICLDHFYSHSKSLFELQLKKTMGIFIPLQIDHILTSNSIVSIKSSMIGEKIVHVDPFIIKNPLQNKCITQKITINSKHKYETKLKQSKDQFELQNLPFGPDLTMILKPERQLNSVTSNLKFLVAEHNNQCIQDRMNSQLKMDKLCYDKKKSFFDSKLEINKADNGGQLQKNKRKFDLEDDDLPLKKRKKFFMIKV
jgi:hypothetical protein